jgi:hypothetical protein
VANVLKHWIEKHYTDFSSSPELLGQLVRFLRDGMSKDLSMTGTVKMLSTCIGRRRELSQNLPKVCQRHCFCDLVELTNATF